LLGLYLGIVGDPEITIIKAKLGDYLHQFLQVRLRRFIEVIITQQQHKYYSIVVTVPYLQITVIIKVIAVIGYMLEVANYLVLSSHRRHQPYSVKSYLNYSQLGLKHLGKLHLQYFDQQGFSL
jgi:hypothetical protein